MSFFEIACLVLLGLIYISLLSSKSQSAQFHGQTIASINQLFYTLGDIEGRIKAISDEQGPHSSLLRIEDSLTNISQQLNVSNSWSIAKRFEEQVDELKHELSGISSELTDLRDIKSSLSNLESLVSNFGSGYTIPEDN